MGAGAFSVKDKAYDEFMGTPSKIEGHPNPGLDSDLRRALKA